MDLSGGLSVLKAENSTVNNEWHSDFSELSTIPEHYNQTKIHLKLGGFQINIIERANNEGIAFAYEIPEQQNISEIGLEEKIHFNFKEDYGVWSTPKREPGKLTA
ncbi:glycoside hydrolase family 97 N-terminal domain-containing protein [Maribacter sp. ANRC-HE7]|uniref:Glycoside hydrolase family 97 N-terminal domain-containing protein n=1 Tax=Maribacter aquimaris TaxID=2737171 RepID=A0ABR7V1C9_9FLAO|nr:glycoside hydrolase family 97 N-terminal domain-containing protein [Maribacter aquimaris]MBD0776957.1 glycoside hydrolase family 97 N-terminal domain-containing protein [Maribacter aquimaris]